MGCSLCRLERRTRWFYEDSDGRFVVIGCDVCHVPMAVWWRHTMKISSRDCQEMTNALQKIAVDFYGTKDGWRIDKKQRKIPDHLHWHARKGRRWRRIDG